MSSAAAVSQHALIERGEHAGARWSTHYDSVRLNSTRGISALPGMRIPRKYGRWVPRDGFIEYLRDYAQRTDAVFEFGVEALRSTGFPGSRSEPGTRPSAVLSPTPWTTATLSPMKIVP